MFTESKTVELKREYVEDIKKTAIAFANCDGGTIYIGIDDDGSVCGVPDVDSAMLNVTNTLRNAVRPDITMFTECKSEVINGSHVVVVSVQRGTARPYYLQGKGIRPEGVYVRQGASTVPASEAAILAMIRETSGDSYEEARSLNQQLTFDGTTAFFKSRGLKFEKQQMRTLHLIGDDGTYTNLAFLLSEQCTHNIKLAVFEGSQKTVFKDRLELSGSVLQQLESAFDYIDRYNRTRAEFQGLERIDRRDYPAEAVREALLNSVVHRDYSFSGPTLISIFDDRIEFVSIGGLLRGIGIDDIMLGVSALRNQHLAEIFYRLKLIEAYGTGILKIRECYRNHAEKPKIEATGNAFKITLPNVNFMRESPGSGVVREDIRRYHPMTSYVKKEDRVGEVAMLCRKKGFIVRKDIEEALNVSQATAILLLREMVEAGVLVKKGKARNVRYYLRR